MKCRKNVEKKIQKVLKENKGELMLLSKFAMCDSKKSRFIKEEEASISLSSLGTKTPLRKLHLLGDILF